MSEPTNKGRFRAEPLDVGDLTSGQIVPNAQKQRYKKEAARRAADSRPSARSEPGEGGPFRKEPLSAESSVFSETPVSAQAPVSPEASEPSYQKQRYKKERAAALRREAAEQGEASPNTGGAFHHEPEKEAGGGPAVEPDPVPNGKFHRKSQTEKAGAAKLRMEKKGQKLEAAQDKLAAHKPPRSPGPVKRVGRAAGRTVHGYVHGKIYQIQHENVGVEAAHHTELVGEAALRKGSRFARRKFREHPAKAVQRAEVKFARATGKYHFHAAAAEHPEMGGNLVSRLWQKQRMKKQYAKKAREAAKQGAKAAEKTAVTTEKLAAKAVGFLKRHPLLLVIALFALLLVIVVQSCTSALTTIGNGTVGSISATTYPSADADLLGAEAAYCGMEAELQAYLDGYEGSHSYDEYHFDLDSIEHDPYVLLSAVSALHEGAWTLDEVQDTLQMLFEKQYILTETVRSETRYHTETAEDGTQTQVAYTYTICTVRLENFNLSHVPVYIMGETQLSRYAMYMAVLGNRQDLYPSSVYVDKYITNPPVHYSVPPEYLSDETFAAILTEAEKYLGYPYVWGGSSPATSFDCSGFVSWVYNQCGWSFGRLGAQGLYNISTPVREPAPGDLVFFTGTYDTPGISHVGIYVGDGMMLHCGDPIRYVSLNTSYWQAHFYAYGRLTK